MVSWPETGEVNILDQGKASAEDWAKHLLNENGPWSLGIWSLAILAFFSGYALTGLALLLLGTLCHPQAQENLKGWNLVGVRLKRAQLAMLAAACIAFAVFDPANMEEGETEDFASLADYEGSKSADTQTDMAVAGEAYTGSDDTAYADPDFDSPYMADDWVSNCSAIDGDTLNCGGERIRLLGIDAPELPGHCAAGRVCVSGDPFASKRSIQQLIEPRMKIVRYGRDDYGRTLAMVYVWGGSLSCRQLRGGHAYYVQEWDNEGAVAEDCPVQPG